MITHLHWNSLNIDKIAFLRYSWNVNFNVQNEYGKLKKVLITSIANTKQAAQETDIRDIKRRHEITRGQQDLAKILEEHGVEAKVIDTERIFGTSAGFARDPFIVIGNKIIVHQHNDGKMDRQAEKALLKMLGLPDASDIIYMKGRDGVRLDGGDILVHNGTIYVGQNGQKTNKLGLSLIDKNFGNDFNIVPMNMLTDETGNPILHLDCVFNILSEDEAMLHAKGLSRRAQNQILDNFKTLEITGGEQKNLGLNILNIGNRHLISQLKHERINNALTESGFYVSTIDFGDTAASKGAVRCAAAPLEREIEQVTNPS